MVKKRALAAGCIGILMSVGGIVVAQKPAPVVQVYKSPTCGCCANWVTHLQKAGFATRVTETDDVASIKAQRGVPARAQSCHTAVVDGYVLEGHVPAADVQRLLRERPAIAGLAVPGMPIGSPGMEVPGQRAQAYDVVAFDKQGQMRVYASH
jgi:hypothetical protein